MLTYPVLVLACYILSDPEILTPVSINNEDWDPNAGINLIHPQSTSQNLSWNGYTKFFPS